MAGNGNRPIEIEVGNNVLDDTSSAKSGSQSESASEYTDVPGLNEGHQKLHRAAMKGKWKAAQEIFKEYKFPMTQIVSPLRLTALHVAASCGRSEFVKKLAEHLDPKDLATQDQMGRTALHYAAVAASVSAAEAMVKRNEHLPQIRDADSGAPILHAARWRHRSKSKDMLEYLYKVTKEDEEEPIYSGPSGANLIVAITASGCYDFALSILKQHPELSSQKNESEISILHVMAMRPSAFRGGHQLSFWESMIYRVVDKLATKDGSNAGSDAADRNLIEQRQVPAFVHKLSPFIRGMNRVLEIRQTDADSIKLVKFVCTWLQKEEKFEIIYEYFFPENNGNSLLHLAVENGVSKLVKVCLKYFPDLVWYTSNGRLLLHTAIEHRRVEIFNHLVDLIGKNTRVYAASKVDENDNNILHLAAQYSQPSHQLMIHTVPGPAFQMRRELQWFKAVEALVYEELTMEKNKPEKKKEDENEKEKDKEKEIKGQIPRELFFKEHENLLKDAKEWMKDTSNSCMLVATLVATVAFAAMITVPGGNNSNTGLPVLSNRKLFIAFSISNALSMISSAVTLLMFLSVYTSRFTENDFLERFPNILLRGLIALFIAIATMMIAFGTAIGLALQRRVKWAYIPITVLACCPALIFTKLQLPLLFQTIVFASGPGFYREQRVCKSRCLTKIGYRPLSKDIC